MTRKTSKKKQKSSDAEDAPEEPSFERAIGRLGDIVEQLEGGDLPLETSLSLFEEGVKIARSSHQLLEKAEQRVEELLSFDGDGDPITRDFDPE